jgi:hypothetical protein
VEEAKNGIENYFFTVVSCHGDEDVKEGDENGNWEKQRKKNAHVQKGETCTN